MDVMTIQAQPEVIHASPEPLLIISAHSWHWLSDDLCRKSQSIRRGRASIDAFDTLRGQWEPTEIWDGANGEVVWGKPTLPTHTGSPQQGQLWYWSYPPSQEAKNLALAAFHAELSSPNYASGIELKYLFRRPDGHPTWAGLATTEGADEDWRCIVSNGCERPEIGVFGCSPNAKGTIRVNVFRREHSHSLSLGGSKHPEPERRGTNLLADLETLGLKYKIKRPPVTRPLSKDTCLVSPFLLEKSTIAAS